MSAYDIGGIIAELERAVERDVDLVILDPGPSPLAYRVFRDGHLLVEKDRAARVDRQTRAILEYRDFKPIEDMCVEGVLKAARRHLDRRVLAAKSAAVEDAVQRIRGVLPPDAAAFRADRRARDRSS